MCILYYLISSSDTFDLNIYIFRKTSYFDSATCGLMMNKELIKEEGGIRV